MTGHEFCAVYLAIKLHFTNENYNYHLGSGRSKIGIEAFEKRKDKFQFHKLARTIKDEDVVPFLVANFVHNVNTWTRNLVSNQCQAVYLDWKRKMESLSYTFENDFRKIMGDNSSPKDLTAKFSVIDGEHPHVLRMYMQDEISLETLVILNKLMSFIPRWNNSITDTIVYPKIALLIRKYENFISVDTQKMTAIIKKCLTV